MTLEPLINASPAIQFHVLTVVPAAVIGGVMLLMRKGTYLHRMAGRVWIVLMVLTALSSFLIHEINLFRGFSPVHILSIAVLVSSIEVIRSARQRNFARHEQVVKSLYFGGIGIAGLFTLMPGRIMHEVVLAPLLDPVLAAVDGNVAGMARQAATGAPVWVWPLLLALVALGVSRMRDREVPVWRLWLLPTVLAGIAVMSIIGAPMSGPGLSAAIAGGLAGLAAGWWSMRAVAPARLAGNRVRVQGECVSLIAILTIFSTRFVAGTLSATNPQLLEMQGLTELFALLPAFCAALMVARALAQAGFNPLRFNRQQLTGDAEC